MTGRGPGWPTVLGLMAAVMTFAVVHPLQLVAVPLALLLIALPPWVPTRLVLGLGLGLLAFMGPRGPLWHAEHGWTLLLGGWFILAVLAWPRGSFVQRAVAAVAATTASGGVIVLLAGGWFELDITVASHYREVADGLGRALPVGGGNAEVLVERAAELPARFFPALLAISSVAALGVAWWIYRRVSPEASALGRLPEFRFPDGWLWALIGGLALLLVPVGDGGARLGSNLVFFMGALYALRGLAVLVALVVATVGPHVLTLVALTVLGLILYPIVVASTLLLGVTDTWLDLRSAGRTVNDEG